MNNGSGSVTEKPKMKKSDKETASGGGEKDSSFLDVKPGSENENTRAQSAVFSLLSAEQRSKGTYRMQSSLLDQVKSFLPTMKAANSQLERVLASNPESLDIENVQDDEGPVIEMNLDFFEDDSSSAEESDDSAEGSSSEDPEKLVLPGQKASKQRPLIEELDKPGSGANSEER